MSYSTTEYAYSVGSLNGTIPYDHVIRSLITVLEDEKATIHEHRPGFDNKRVETDLRTEECEIAKKAVTKIAQKLEEWVVMRSNFLGTTKRYENAGDKRLFDYDQLKAIMKCDTYGTLIRTLETMLEECRIVFEIYYPTPRAFPRQW